MKPWKTFLLLATIASLPALAFGQQRVDIQLHRGDDGALKVLLTAANDFDGLLSSLVFTLAWDTTRMAAEPILSQSPEQHLAIPLAASGPAFSVGATKYRKYAGIGMTPLFEGPLRLQAGKSLCIAQVDGLLPEAAHISQASWLRERRHNGAFYVSLNGADMTGQVMSASDGATPLAGPDFSIAPNPYGGGPLTYAFFAQEDGMVQLTLFNAQAKQVAHWTISTMAGNNTGVLLPPSLAPGAYSVRSRSAGMDKTVPLMVVER